MQGNGHRTDGHAGNGRRADGAGSWERVEGTRELAELTAARRRFVVPALIVFAVVFGGFLICVAYAQDFMATRAIGGFTWAYVWALALIVMTWAIALAYLRYSDRKLGPLTERAVERGPVRPREPVR